MKHHQQETILVVDDEPGIRRVLETLFQRNHYKVISAEGVSKARQVLNEDDVEPSIVVTDVMMPDGSGMEVLEAAHQHRSETQVIVMTAFSSIERAVEAMRKGAYDFLEKPLKNEVLLATVEKALERVRLSRENQSLRNTLHKTWSAKEMVGKSDALGRVRAQIEKFAPTSSNVLITGESGTGKEVVARALHGESMRAEQDFVVVNCGALPNNLIESELFGHEKGAFTGAVETSEGVIRAAHGGTIFLDEIGELPIEVQAKLLRVLQEGTVRAVGSSEQIQVDVRVVAATNRRLEEEVEAGRFREDLFYRLNILRIEVPPLRRRLEDVPLLAKTFLRKHNTLQGKSLAFSDAAMRMLCCMSYPGNIRELQNIIERAVTMAQGNVIDASLLPEDASTVLASKLELPTEGFSLEERLNEIEKDYLFRALEQADGVQKTAAKLLGMNFRQFRYRLKKHQDHATEQ